MKRNDPNCPETGEWSEKGRDGKIAARFGIAAVVVSIAIFAALIRYLWRLI